MTDFRKSFPDLNFWGAADLIAEGDFVVGRWEGGGTHSGPAFSDFLMGSLPAATGRKMQFTGTTVLKLKDGKIVEEIGLDDGVTASAAWYHRSKLNGRIVDVINALIDSESRNWAFTFAQFPPIRTLTHKAHLGELLPNAPINHHYR